VVDAAIIAVPSLTKIQTGWLDPEMHQSKKGHQRHFGMKACIGVDAESGLMYTVVAPAADVNDLAQARKLLHRHETDVFAFACYQSVGKLEEAQALNTSSHIAMRPGKRAALDQNNALTAKNDQVEQTKDSTRA
jgi:transposase, IS5 family